jgi:hypothetical protein
MSGYPFQCLLQEYPGFNLMVGDLLSRQFYYYRCAFRCAAPHLHGSAFPRRAPAPSL